MYWLELFRRTPIRTYPLPSPGTYPKGAVTPRNGFLFLFNSDILKQKNTFTSTQKTFLKWRTRPRLHASASSLTVYHCAPFFESVFIKCNMVVKALSCCCYMSNNVNIEKQKMFVR